MQQCAPCMQPAKMAGIQCDCRPIFPDGTLPKTKELEQIHTTAING